MRWPFGPPHLTLKPSHQKIKRTAQKTNTEGLGPSEVARKQKDKKNTHTHTQKDPKKNFQLSANLQFFGGCPKFPFFYNYSKKARPPKHCKNRGSARHFLKNRFASRNRHFGQKQANPEIPVIMSFCLFSSLSTTRSKNSWNPHF